MSNKPYFEPIKTDTDVYDLSHLNPFIIDFKSNLAKKNLRINVTFTNHVFTKSYIQGFPKNGFPLFGENTERVRIFCPIRYRLSKDLPKLIMGLNNEKSKVKQTRSRRNWAHSITIEDPTGPYHIFFEVRKSANDKKRFQEINLTVESAYHEDEDSPRFLGRIGFQLLCSKIYMNKPVSTKR
nr:hypothetical protein [Vibrio sp. 10N.286.48.B7]PMH78505.1 hypothetical protein BCU58_09015 [Vibrio sp. 10N.286.48.B7]